MKYLLFLLLACLAGLEYFHHRSDSHAHHEDIHASPEAKAERARDLLRQHHYSH
jgi:hypothetical protein